MAIPLDRPRARRGVLAEAVALVRTDLPALAWVTLALLAWASVIPTIVAYMSADAVVVTGRELRFVYLDEASADAAEAMQTVFALLLAGSLLVAEVALARMLADRRTTHAAPDRRRELRHALRRAPSALWIGLLVTTAFAVVFLVVRPPVGGTSSPSGFQWLVFVLAAAYLFAMFSLALPALGIDGTRGTRALRRSWRLVAGRRWRTIGTLLAAGIAAAAVQLAAGGLVVAATRSLGGGTVLLATTAASVALQCLTVPFVVAVLTVLYLRLGDAAAPAPADVSAPPPGPEETR